MPKKLIRRYLPHHSHVTSHKCLQIFGSLLHDPNLFHLNRHSVSTAFAIGCFCAFIPLPFQMVIATFFAILLRANILVSFITVWITNPLTIPPIFYTAYQFGAWLLDTPVQPFTFELSVTWLTEKLLLNWKPFLTGCFAMGVISATTAYITIQLLWRWSISHRWKNRHRQLPLN